MAQLKQPYIPLTLPDGTVTYGGNQMLFENRTVKYCGCGLIAATDLLIYLCRYHNCRIGFISAMPERDLPLAEYRIAAGILRTDYLPILPGAGIPNVGLAAGLNRVFKMYGLPYTAGWYVPRARLWATIEEMLAKDLPVIMTAGRNFPNIFGRDGVPFYRPDSPVPSATVLAHYFTVTGLDQERVTVSTWGTEYYFFRSDYEDFVRRSSSPLLSSILVLRETGAAL